MKIGILFDGASTTAPFPDQLITGTVDAVAAELTSEGNDVVRVAVQEDARWVERLRRARVVRAPLRLEPLRARGREGRLRLGARGPARSNRIAVFPHAGHSVHATRSRSSARTTA